jgi:hypothetical protein
METIEIQTLIDITNSGINRYTSEKEKEFNQYKNWVTLLQCVGLRSIIQYDENPQSELVDIKDFGTKYKGKHRVWTFKFKPDREDTYNTKDDPIGLLVEDLHQVPVIKNLDETINISKTVFDLVDKGYKNTKLIFVKHGMEK